MEASTTRIVGHEVDMPGSSNGHTVAEKSVLEALAKARVRNDRWMTMNRVVEEAASFRTGEARIGKAVRSLCAKGEVRERKNGVPKETTYVLSSSPPSAPVSSLFDKMLGGGVQPEVKPTVQPQAEHSDAGPYKCPYCPESTRTEVGRNIHISLMHKGMAQVPRAPQASYSTPKPPEPSEEEEDEDDEPEVFNGSGVEVIAAMHKKLMQDAQKHGWTVEVLEASKKFAEIGVIKFLYNANPTKVAS